MLLAAHHQYCGFQRVIGDSEIRLLKISCESVASRRSASDGDGKGQSTASADMPL